eukprot:1235743-Amorphochlora_amoeboformis.AAC.1
MVETSRYSTLKHSCLTRLPTQSCLLHKYATLSVIYTSLVVMLSVIYIHVARLYLGLLPRLTVIYTLVPRLTVMYIHVAKLGLNHPTCS